MSFPPSLGKSRQNGNYDTESLRPRESAVINSDTHAHSDAPLTLVRLIISSANPKHDTCGGVHTKQCVDLQQIWDRIKPPRNSSRLLNSNPRPTTVASSQVSHLPAVVRRKRKSFASRCSFLRLPIRENVSHPGRLSLQLCYRSTVCWTQGRQLTFVWFRTIKLEKHGTSPFGTIILLLVFTDIARCMLSTYCENEPILCRYILLVEWRRPWYPGGTCIQ